MSEARQDGTTVAPILPSRDVGETLRFYGDLGFLCRCYGEPAPTYVVAWRGDVELHFFAMPDLDPAASYAGCYLRVGDADAFMASLPLDLLPAEGIPRAVRPEDKPWGLREGHLVDPSGNLIRIGRPRDPG